MSGKLKPYIHTSLYVYRLPARLKMSSYNNNNNAKETQSENHIFMYFFHFIYNFLSFWHWKTFVHSYTHVCIRKISRFLYNSTCQVLHKMATNCVHVWFMCVCVFFLAYNFYIKKSHFYFGRTHFFLIKQSIFWYCYDKCMITLAYSHLITIIGFYWLQIMF